MTVVPLESLPLGFRFHPTDEELVNHYLKRKITGRIRAEIEVIPRLMCASASPGISQNDRGGFSLHPRTGNTLMGNGLNRRQKPRYWKATGKDRTIRSKKNPATIGMKKTLVFHKGRAPKGERTQWIMHEYRTTEPEYESGDQGGFVLYRLFNKQEEKSPSSNADEVERSGFSPTPSRSSPGDTQHDADAMEETANTSNKESPASDLQEDPLSIPNSVENQPAGIKRWLADKADCSTAYTVKADENFHNINPENCVGEARAKISEQQNEKIDPNEFPNISSPMLPYTDHRFFGNINQEPDMGFNSDNIQNDEMNELLIQLLSGPDEYPFAATDFPKDSVAETAPQHIICDAASWKDSGASSDLEMEGGINQ
ncbi:NAC domain-containing protein 14, partial [Ananas comosus]